MHPAWREARPGQRPAPFSSASRTGRSSCESGGLTPLSRPPLALQWPLTPGAMKRRDGASDGLNSDGAHRSLRSSAKARGSAAHCRAARSIPGALLRPLVRARMAAMLSLRMSARVPKASHRLVICLAACINDLPSNTLMFSLRLHLPLPTTVHSPSMRLRGTSSMPPPPAGEEGPPQSWRGCMGHGALRRS